MYESEQMWKVTMEKKSLLKQIYNGEEGYADNLVTWEFSLVSLSWWQAFWNLLTSEMGIKVSFMVGWAPT